jgi:hypothetical protein
MATTIEQEIAAPTTLENDVIFSDDFSRYANGVLAGKTPEVGSYAWLTTGAGVAGEGIVDGEWSSTAGVTYAVMQLSATPWEYGGVFESKNGTSFLALVACLLDFTTYGLNVMWHPLINTSTPSASAWTPTYFDSASRPGGTNVTGGSAGWKMSIGSFGLAANTKYRYRVILNAPWADHVIETLDGTVIATMRAYQANLASLIGPWMFIEVGSGSRPFVWHSAYARTKPANDSIHRRRILGGIEATPIGAFSTAAGTFTAVHAGPGAPKGVSSSRYDGTAADAPGAYSTGAALFKVQSETPGNVAEMQVINGAGGAAGWKIDGAYVVTHYSSQGTYLTKPFSAAPYFASGVRLNGASSPLLTSGTAAPTTGTYALGDRVFNSAPAVGSPKGWICTVAGTPGTWVSEGNL